MAAAERISKKSILYVTSDWASLHSFLYARPGSTTGMPSFFKPLIKLSELEYRVNVVILGRKNLALSRVSSIISGVTFYYAPCSSGGTWPKITALIAWVGLAIKIARREHVGFVYGHGSHAWLGLLLGLILRVPAAARIYGTGPVDHLYRENKLLCSLRMLVGGTGLWLTSNLPSRFCFITNDGSLGPKLIEKASLFKDIKFHHKPVGKDSKRRPKSPYRRRNEIIVPGRLVSKKNIHEAVEILHLLRLRGIDVIMLSMGALTDATYLKFVRSLIDDYGLEDRFIISGLIEQKVLHGHMKHAVCMLSLQSASNAGNALFESLSNGCPVVSKPDRFLDEVDPEGAIVLRGHAFDAIVDHIVRLTLDMDYWKSIKEKSFELTERSLSDWQERIKFEIDLIERELDFS
jgi:glycosyltransferase involved in cell wall biosynthesis